MEIVSVLRQAIADRVGKERFELWFGASTSLALNGRTLTVTAPNQFICDWLRTSFRHHIEDACVASLGESKRIEFNVDETLPQPVSESPRRNPPQSRKQCNGEKSQAFDASQPPPLSGGVGPRGRTSRRKFADLESFVEGPSNKLARAAAEMVTLQPGELSPLVIHGPTSVGKTHLLECIWTEARRSNRGLAAVYLSAEEFTTGFLEALRGGGLPSFRRKYRGVELLIIDDLQFFPGKRATLVELLHTADTLLRSGGQLVFAADRSPAELTALGPELVTRLESGMVCRIDPPDYETRLGIIAGMCRRFDLVLPPEVSQFIASRLTNHARELSGALCRLQAASRAQKQRITLPLAEEALAEMIRTSRRVVRLGDIEKAVCETFGIEQMTLQSERTAKSVTHPRMLAMWLARKHTPNALAEIGHYFGRRSHSTVVSAQKRVERWLAAGHSLKLADRTWDVDEAIRQVERCLKTG
jgi:chromosomal replication initiator protein